MTNFFEYHDIVGVEIANDNVLYDTCEVGLEKSLYLFNNTGDTGNMLLKVGQKNGSSITVGSGVLEAPDGGSGITSAPFGRCGYVQDDKALVIYGETNLVMGYVVNISSLTPTPTTHSVIQNGSVSADSIEEIWMPPLNDGEFLLVYQFGTSIRGNRITVSGDTITAGSQLTLLSNEHTLYQAIQLITGKILVLYYLNSSPATLRAKIIHSVTNSTFSAGTEVVVDTDAQYNPVIGVSWDGIESVIIGGEDDNTRLRIHGATESSGELTVHQLSYEVGYSNLTGGINVGIALNNKGLVAFNRTSPFHSSYLAELDYNTTSKEALFTYGFLLSDESNSGVHIFTKMSEELALLTWLHPGFTYIQSMYITTYVPLSAYFWGVWQDGLAITYKSYDVNLGAFSDVYLGTHVANDNIVVFSYYTQLPPYDTWYDKTFNLLSLTYNTYWIARSYALSYGATYSAVKYQSTYTNIRAIGFV